MVLNVFLVPNKLGYGGLASLFAARGNVGPPNLVIRVLNPLNIIWPLLYLTFGGMWRWRRVAVARVFALVVRCRVMRLLLYSRVGKNRDTRRESPAGAGAGRGASHEAFLFSYPIVAPRSANDIYRPVRDSSGFIFICSEQRRTH